MTEDMGVPATRSGSRPAGGAASASPAKPSIPNAGDVRFLSAGPDPRGGFTFSFADGEENGVIRLLAEHLYEMMGVGTPHELNCVQMEVIPRGFQQSFTLTLQRNGGKTPLQLKAEAVGLLKYALEAIESNRSEPLARDAIRNFLAEDKTAPQHTASAMEAGTVETEGLDAKHDGPVAESETPK